MLALVVAAPDQFTELARFPAIEGKTWNHPVLVGDILLARNAQEMGAFRLSLAGGGSGRHSASSRRAVMRRLDKAQMRQRGRELRALLNEWDPIGVGPDGPADEYDCLLWDVMGRLERQVSAADLSSFLVAELEQHFGLRADLAGVEAFVSRARGWFEKNWKNTLA